MPSRDPTPQGQCRTKSLRSTSVGKTKEQNKRLRSDDGLPRRGNSVSDGRKSGRTAKSKRSNLDNVRSNKKEDKRKGRLVITDDMESDDDEDDSNDDRVNDDGSGEESNNINGVGDTNMLIDDVEDEEDEDDSSDEEEKNKDENEENGEDVSDEEDELPEMTATAGRGNNRNGKKTCMPLLYWYS